MLQGEQRGEVWFLNRAQVSIGRALDNDLVLLDISSSRKHAQITRHASGFAILDLRSANGVYLNQRRITEEELYDHDELEIGETLIRFEMVGSSRPRVNDEDDTSPGLDAPVRLTAASAPRSLRASSAAPALPPPMPPQQSAPSASIAAPLVPSRAQVPLPPAPFSTQALSSGQAIVSSHQAHASPRAAEQNIGVPPPFQMTLGGDPSPLVHPQAQAAQGSHAPQPPQDAPQDFHVTYGFGSQMSPADLDPDAGRLRPGGLLSSISSLASWKRHFAALVDEAQFGRGRRASVIRLTAFVSAILLCFLIGLSLSRIAAMWSNAPSSPVTTIAAPSPAKAPTDLKQQGIIQEMEGFVKQRKWRKAISFLKAESVKDPQLLTGNPRLNALYSKVELELIRVVEPKISGLVQSGQLKLAFRQFEELSRDLSAESRRHIIHLRYTLWLYDRELRGAQNINPPRREQEVLAKAARLTLRGDRSGATKLLKRTRVPASRRPLFKLRIEATKSIRDEIREAELSYLLCSERNTQSTLRLYKAAIKNGVRQTNYRQIAPWIEGALRLSEGTPREFESLMKTKRQLKREARKWLSKAEALRSSPLQARALLDAALPYLEDDDERRARRLLRSLRR